MDVSNYVSLTLTDHNIVLISSFSLNVCTEQSLFSATISKDANKLATSVYSANNEGIITFYDMFKVNLYYIISNIRRNQAMSCHCL